MNTWKDLQAKLIEFRNERDWEQFHNPKDLALALSIEAAELNEVFLCKCGKGKRGTCRCFCLCLTLSGKIRP
jgi:hypothetical protein